MKRFYLVNTFLVFFFAAWALIVWMLAEYYGSWGLMVIAAVPLSVSALFINQVFSIFRPLDTLFVLFPLMEIAAAMLRIDKDDLRGEVIEYNNRRTMLELSGGKGGTRPVHKGSEVLLILPHCIQNSECLYKVTWDKLENCRLCGKCSIPDFIKLKEQYGVGVVIVSGGTAAREIIRQKKPSCILAVACETDLISGLREVKSIPVIAVLNQRPCGPCRDTVVDLGVIKSYLDRIIK